MLLLARSSAPARPQSREVVQVHSQQPINTVSVKRASTVLAMPVVPHWAAVASSSGSAEFAGVPGAVQKLVARLVCEEHCSVFFTGNAGTGASCAPKGVAPASPKGCARCG